MTPEEKLVRADELEESGEWAGAAAVRVSATGLKPVSCQVRLAGWVRAEPFSVSAFGAVRRVSLPRLAVCHRSQASILADEQDVLYPSWVWVGSVGWGHNRYNFAREIFDVVVIPAPPDWMRPLLEQVSRAAVAWVLLPGRSAFKTFRSRTAAFQRLLAGAAVPGAGRGSRPPGYPPPVS